MILIVPEPAATPIAHWIHSMTIGIAWIQKSGKSDELWIASDSRLSGDGNVWDECPKLFTLPRQGCIAAFCGTTAQAYPLVLQMSNSILGHRPALDGTLELNLLLEHLERVVNSMLDQLKPDPAILGGQARREFATRSDKVIVGGFSRQNGLVIRSLRYENSVNGWIFSRVRSSRKVGPNKPFHIFGDHFAASRFYYLFEQHLRRRRKFGNNKPLVLEPLETLWEFLQMPEEINRPLPMNRRPPTIGGPVQAVRVVAGAQVLPYVIRWGQGSQSTLHVLGRQLLEKENVNLPLIEQTGGPRRLEVRAAGKWKP